MTLTLEQAQRIVAGALKHAREKQLQPLAVVACGGRRLPVAKPMGRLRSDRGRGRSRSGRRSSRASLPQ